MILFVYMEQNIFSIKENLMCRDSNRMFNYRIKFKLNYIIFIKIMRCKIVRFQKFMWCHYEVKKKKKIDFTL